MMNMLLVPLLACCWALLLAPAPAGAEPLPASPGLIRAVRSHSALEDDDAAAATLAKSTTNTTTTTTTTSTSTPTTTTTTTTATPATFSEASSTSAGASKTITNLITATSDTASQAATTSTTTATATSTSTSTSTSSTTATAAAKTTTKATSEPPPATTAHYSNTTGELDVAPLGPGAGLTTSPLPGDTWSPRSERAHVLEMFNKFFLQSRSHDDQKRKEFVRDGVVLRMRELGFDNSFVQKSRFEFRRRATFSDNMISILPGPQRGTPQEKILLVGAHWDSATKAPGVDDNGSGSTCLLEIARLISAHKCKFNHTVMLVWFDYEEQGKYGSEFFVNDYLYPYELDKHKSKFIGAYILDMILVRDKEINSQQLPASLRPKLPEFFEELDREKNRGDFLATWARKRWDEPLESTFRWAWERLGHESRTFKAMRPELPQRRMPNADERYQWKDFFRSDHASFWFPPLTSPAVRKAPNRTSGADHASLNAILLTDLGPWRQSYKNCYHAACDDHHLLTDDNLAFMQQVVDALVLSLMRSGEGKCEAPPPPAQLAESGKLSNQQPPHSESHAVAAQLPEAAAGAAVEATLLAAEASTLATS